MRAFLYELISDLLGIGCPRWVQVLAWLAVFLVCATAWSSIAHSQVQHLTVRSCANQPTASGFNGCPSSTWELASGARFFQALRGAEILWLQRPQLLAGDRVFACALATVTPGSAYGGGCSSPLPGRTDNWLPISQLVDQPAPGRAIPIRWEASPDPVTGYTVYTRAAREDGSGEWRQIGQVGAEVRRYSYATTERTCFVVQANGVEGPGGVTEQDCFAPIAVAADPPPTRNRPTNLTVE